MKSNSISNAVRVALLAGVGTIIVAPVALSQDATQSSQTTNQNQSTNTAVKLGTVEVTGTRILRTSTETAQPITIVTQKQIKATGLTTIGQVLQNLTQSGSAINTLVNNGGSGATNIDLRYFGANRVLVLVNGRRWTPDLSGAVDINSIPTSVVDHIEILQDGASAIYGSDAITGVVNIITVKNFNGAEASAYMGMYDNDYGGYSGWDGKVQQYSYTIGLSGDHSSLVANLSYNNQNVVWGGNRAQTSPIGPFSTGQVSSWSTLKGQFVMNIGNRPSPGSATCSPWAPAQPDPSNPGSWTPATGGTCNMTLINVPTMNPSLDNFENYSIAGNRMRASSSPFQTPLETKSAYLQGHYDISNNVTFTSMAAITVRTSQQQLSAGPQSIGSTSGPDIANYLPFGIGANNPYNPFHTDLVANSSQFCPTAHYAGGAATCTPNNNIMLYTVGRLFAEGGQRVWNQNNTSYTVRMGLNGFFNALGGEWDWDLGSSYGNVYQSTSATSSYNTSQMVQQLDSPGWAQCNGPGQADKPGGDSVEVGGLYYPILIPGCVPMNVFGGAAEIGNTLQVNGSLTPAMLAYTAFDDHSIEEMSIRDYTADITGDIAQLPAGPLAVALGAEYLEQDGYDHPDALRVEGNVDEGPALPTGGRQWTNAEFVEFNIPLLSDVIMAKSLTLDIANRWSQFTWAGEDAGSSNFGVKQRASATTARAQIRWQPTEDLLFRGSWAQGFRVPDLSELYAGSSQNFPSVQDPCAGPPNGSWVPGTPLPVGCKGVAHTQLNGQIGTISGGNSDLTPETAITRSAGFVYNPGWLPGFDISADYFKIDLGNVVGSIDPNLVVQECYVQNNPSFCSRIHTSGGSISLIRAGNANTGEEYARGWDVTADYRLPATAIGTFSIGTNWTFMQSFVDVVASASSSTGWESYEEVGFNGEKAIPHKKGNVSFNWNLGNWSAHWFVQYIGHMWASCNGVQRRLGFCSNPEATFTYQYRNTQGMNYMGRTIYHDVSATYHVDPVNMDVTLGIRNLFNKQPPTPFNDFVGYRVPGRFVYATLGVKF